MATLTAKSASATSTYVVPPEIDALEPDERWKSNLRDQIEGGLRSMVNDAKKNLDEQLNKAPVDAEQRELLTKEHMETMRTIRRLAQEQFDSALERERVERRWTAGKPVDPKWEEILVKEQQAIMDNISKKDDGPSDRARAHSDIHFPNQFDARSPTSPSTNAERENGYFPSTSHRDAANFPSNGRAQSDSIADRSRGDTRLGTNTTERLPDKWKPSQSPVTEPDRSVPYRQGSTDRKQSFNSVIGRNEGPSRSSGAGVSPLERRPTERWQTDQLVDEPEEMEFSSRPSTERFATGRRQSAHSISPKKPHPSKAEIWKPTISPEDAAYSKTFRRASNASLATSYRSPASIPIPERLDSSDVAGQAERERASIFAVEQEWTGLTRAREKQGSMRADSRQNAASEVHKQRLDERYSFSSPTASPFTSPPESPRYAPTSSNRPIVRQRSSLIDDPSHVNPSARLWPGPSRSPSDQRYEPAYHSQQATDDHPRSSSSLRAQMSRQDVFGGLENDTFDESDDDSDMEEQSSEVDTARIEADAMRMKQEMMRKAEEVRLKEEEVRRKAEEARKKDEEARRKDAELKQKAEEVRKREEEVRRREEELNRREEEAKRKEEEDRAREAEARRKEEEEKVRKREEEVRRKEEELNRREEEARRREAEKAAEREAEIRRDEVRRMELDLERREEAKRLEAEKAAEREAETRRKEADREARRIAEVRRKEVEKEAERAAEVRRMELEKERREADFRQKEAARRKQSEEAETLRKRSEGEAGFGRKEAEWRRGGDDDFRKEAEKQRVQQEEFRKREEDIRRRTEERRRQDSTGSDGLHYGFSTSPPKSGPSPWPAHRSGNSGSSSASTDRSSTSSNHSSGGWSQSSRTSTQSSNTSRTSTASTGSAKPGRPSGPGPAFTEVEWARRQEQHAREQQEKFRREQEQKERERLSKGSRILTKDEIIRMFESHERQWSKIVTMDRLTWDSFPWPMLKMPSEPDDLTPFAIESYVLSPFSDNTKSEKDRIKEHIRRWHPDRFETKLLPKVVEKQQEKVKEGAGSVVRALNGFLTRPKDSVFS